MTCVIDLMGLRPQWTMPAASNLWRAMKTHGNGLYPNDLSKHNTTHESVFTLMFTFFLNEPSIGPLKTLYTNIYIMF